LRGLKRTRVSGEPTVRNRQRSLYPARDRPARNSQRDAVGLADRAHRTETLGRRDDLFSLVIEGRAGG